MQNDPTPDFGPPGVAPPPNYHPISPAPGIAPPPPLTGMESFIENI